MIDDYPEDNQHVDILTNLLLNETQKMQSPLVLVIVSRREHRFSETFKACRVMPLTVNETKAVINQRLCTDPYWVPESILHRQRMHVATQGHPKKLEILATNREMWTQFVDARMGNISDYFDEGMRQIWATLDMPGRLVMRMLFSMTMFFRYLEDELIREAVVDWGSVRDELASRSLVKHEQGSVYTLHDSVSEYIRRNEMPDSELRRCHGALALYFFRRGNKNQRHSDLLLSAGHAFQSGDSAVIGLVGQRALQVLKDYSQYHRLATIAEDAEPVLQGTGSIMEARIWYEKAYAAIMLGNYPEAVPFAERAVSRAMELGDQLTAAEGLWLQGEGLRYQSRYDEAMQKLNESTTIFERLGVSGSDTVLGPVWASWDRARVWTALGELKKAEDELNLTFKNRKTIETPEVEISFSCGQGMIYQARGSAPDAIVCFERGLTLSKDSGNLYWEAESCALISEVSLLTGEFDRAIQLCEYAVNIHNRLAIPDRQAETERIQAEIALHQGDPSNAVALVLTAIATFERNQHRRAWATAKLVWISAELALRYDESTDFSSSPAALLHEINGIEQRLDGRGDTPQKVRATRLRAEILRVLGKMPEAEDLYSQLVSDHGDAYGLEAVHAKVGLAACSPLRTETAKHLLTVAAETYNHLGHKSGHALCQALLSSGKDQSGGVTPLIARWVSRCDLQATIPFPIILPC